MQTFRDVLVQMKGIWSRLDGGQKVVVHEEAGPGSGTWVGRIEVPPGEEALTRLELRYTGAAEVELFGELVDRPGLLARARASQPRKPKANSRPPEPSS